MRWRLRWAFRRDEPTKTYRLACDEIEPVIMTLIVNAGMKAESRLFQCVGGVGLVFKMTDAQACTLCFLLEPVGYSLEKWRPDFRLGLHPY